MTYSLPFGLTQKPVNKKFEHGEIHFSMKDGTMYFEVTHSEKTFKHKVLKGIVKTKEQYNYLMSVKEFPIRINAEMEPVPLWPLMKYRQSRSCNNE